MAHTKYGGRSRKLPGRPNLTTASGGMPKPRRKTPKGAFKRTGMKRGWKMRMRKRGASIKQIRRKQVRVRRRAGLGSYVPYKSRTGRRRRI